jgi:2-isopropylmalate synthase
MRPEDVGVPQATLVLGKHSGRHAVQCRCEQIGLTLDRRELDEVYRGVITLADREKIVNDRDLVEIVNRVRGGQAAKASSTSTGSATTATADFTATPAEIGYGHGV